MDHTKKLNMSLRKVKILDNNFSHAKYSTDYQESKYIEWLRNSIANNDEIIFLTDNTMRTNYSVSGIRIGLLMEPRVINPSIYEWVSNNHDNFNTIFTYDKELLSLGGSFKFYPHCGCWIKPEDQLIHNKTKLLSIVASSKTQTTGHKLRHESIKSIIENYNNLDVYGRGYNKVDYKLDAFKEYAFSIVIENSKADYYFTEKLIDSFITGTVPIYWGCPSISDFFNLDGMIIFNNIDDLHYKLGDLSLEKYKSMLPAIKENFEKAKAFLIAEDWIYNNTNIFK